MPPRTLNSPELRQFNTEMYCLLKAHNPRARSFFSFINRTLRQFHLEQVHAESEIFNEAYMRGVAFILKGNTIVNPKAWMRSTALNVIREFARVRQRQQSNECECTENLLLVPEEIFDLDTETVLAALQELESGDRLIIELKTIEGLSWKEVKKRLIELGEEPQTEAALRKRGQRAMQKLRQIYHNKRTPDSLVLAGNKLR